MSEEQKKTGKQRPPVQGERAKGGKAALEKRSEKRAKQRREDELLLAESSGDETNYVGDKMSERDFSPVRGSREYRSGCLGGLMFFVFIVCVSVVFAALAWMAASDTLALNKETFTATVTLPASAFETKTVAAYDKEGNQTGTERVTVADIDYVASALKEAGLIEYKWLFSTFCKMTNADGKIDPGSYELRSSYDYRALVNHMRVGAGASETVLVTLPEGFTMRQMFKRLEENGVCKAEDLMEAAASYQYNYSFLEGVEPGDAARLEGYLFPETYEFYVGMQASSTINKFLTQFHYVWNADLQAAADARGMTIQEVLTVASMIEKEAAVDVANGVDERARVAAVIYNRLNAGMSLGLESTLLYLYPDHEGPTTSEMLNTESPYNTIRYPGLPPTPICNPGLDAIKAALYPETTGEYYFTLDEATGQHRFFTNAAEFNAFVATQSYGQ